MLPSLLYIAGTFAIGAFAAPAGFIMGSPMELSESKAAAMVRSVGAPPGSFCLSNETAVQVGDLWRTLLSNYTKADAEAGLTANYTDYSASALSLNSVCQQAPGPAPTDVTAPVFTNRTIFELAQGSQPSIPSTRLNVFHSCHTVTMRYEMYVQGDTADPVVGNIILEVVQAPPSNKYPFQISLTYSEFDSEAWVKVLQKKGICQTPTTSGKA